MSYEPAATRGDDVPEDTDSVQVLLQTSFKPDARANPHMCVGTCLGS